MQVDQTPVTVCVSALWAKLLNRKDEDGRESLTAAIDEIAIEDWAVEALERMRGPDVVARIDDDVLLAALGFTREQIEREVSQRGQ